RDDVRFQRMGNLDGHVAESAETDNTDFLALCDTPAAHGRVCGDPSTQERRSPGEIEVGRDAQNETLVDDDAVGITSVGDATEILVRGVEGKPLVRAEVLKARFALGTGAVRVDQAPNRAEVTHFIFGHRRADLGHTPNDLVAGDNRVNRGHELAPLVADRMEIGVADAAEENINLHIVFGWIAPRDRCAGKRRGRASSGMRRANLMSQVLYELPWPWVR